MVRTSTSWKSKEMRRPLKDFLIGSRAEAARFHIALLADFKAVAAVAQLRAAHIPAALVADSELGVVADALEGDIAHWDLKSDTSKLRCA